MLMCRCPFLLQSSCLFSLISDIFVQYFAIGFFSRDRGVFFCCLIDVRWTTKTTTTTTTTTLGECPFHSMAKLQTQDERQEHRSYTTTDSSAERHCYSSAQPVSMELLSWSYLACTTHTTRYKSFALLPCYFHGILLLHVFVLFKQPTKQIFRIMSTWAPCRMTKQ